MTASLAYPQSPQWRNGKFHNPQPLWMDVGRALASTLTRVPGRIPKDPIPVATPSAQALSGLSASGLQVTWLGHSTVYLELDGIRILTDPMWGQWASPLPWIGPRRWFPPLLPLEQLPIPELVVISHNHYDHLDRSTLAAMKDWDTRFIVPLGVGARLSAWGIRASRITELDWWDQAQAGPVTITCTPARHSTGRGLFDRDKTLWAGYAFRSAEHRVYFSGDTGLFPGLADIGSRLGPFDLTLVEVGGYGSAWPDMHLGPEQAVTAHERVQGRVMLPIHWGLFNLAPHGWTEPVERVLAAAKARSAVVLAPRPGASMAPPWPAPVRWWPALPWKTGAESPIRATANGLKVLPD